MYRSTAVTSEVLMTQAAVNVVHHGTTRSLRSIGEPQNKHLVSYRERCGSLSKKIN
jgi:hypothetical protein